MDVQHSTLRLLFLKEVLASADTMAHVDTIALVINLATFFINSIYILFLFSFVSLVFYL